MSRVRHKGLANPSPYKKIVKQHGITYFFFFFFNFSTTYSFLEESSTFIDIITKPAAHIFLDM